MERAEGQTSSSSKRRRVRPLRGEVRQVVGGCHTCGGAEALLEVERALGSVVAKTAYGSVQRNEVGAGSVEAESGYGEVSVGEGAGVPAWLDLASKNGPVRNDLALDRAPSGSEQFVAVRVRTQFGDIDVRRVPMTWVTEGRTGGAGRAAGRGAKGVRHG